ncbi:hypothetical protein CLLI_19620 [Clostridium liquoris]|jgi:uncharacterized membrane protein YkvA (DUF1232 family)|uniref:DUF1232 domain-containing protein n=1 Tax=Clostridium liquoris TaxID=1289519 RepID=A0A2T0B2D3_9CLOT|nr:DUF1232 domain-containing protein [Clostridium liquoris]PRR78042.1 hypothetical protein CLLI_19620 [Clostridium liquoris]
MNLKEKANEIKIYIPALFIAIKRKDTPIIAKIFAVITVGYALSPIDVVPDFIPVLGYLDDLIILPLLAALAIKFIPDEIMKECKIEAENMWKDGKPKKWYYAIPIVVLWLLVIGWIVSKFIH